MPVSAQINALSPQGIKKKKTNLMAPYVQEQARQGVATQMVMDQKAQGMQDEAKAFRDAEFEAAQQQNAAQNAQWQTEFEAQQNQWNAEMSARKKQNDINTYLGFGSLALELGGLLDLF